MPWFRYVATDSDGNRISGELQANSQEDAATSIEASGLFPLTIETYGDESFGINERAVGKPGQGSVWLSSADLKQVTSRIGELAKASLPLVTGLRALSEEVPSRRLRRVLTVLSERLSNGESLDSALGQRPGNMPEHVVGLIRAGLITNNLGGMIEQYLRYARDAREVRRKVCLSLSYPLILIGVSVVVFVAILSFIVPQFDTIFAGFDVALPLLTRFLIELSEVVRAYWIWILLGTLVAAILVWWLFELTGGKALRRRIIGTIPFFGPMFRYSSLARFCHLLGIMIENRIRLPDALRMASAAVKDANIQEGCLLLAQDVEEGHSLNDAALNRPHFPMTIANTFRWQEHGDAFADALYASGEIYSAMAKTQTGLVRVVFEPLLIVFVACFLGFIVLALFMPLMQLLNDLS